MTRSLMAVPLLFLLACAGGGNKAPALEVPPPIPDAAISGIYTGTVYSNETGMTHAVHALIMPDLTFRYVTSDWTEAVGSMIASGNAIKGAGTMYVPPSSAYSLSISATASSTRLSGSFSDAGTGTVTLTPDATANVSVNQLYQIPGNYQALAADSSTGLDEILRIDGNGNITGGDSWGYFTGLIYQTTTTGLNAFSVSITYTTNRGAVINYSGSAYLEPGSPSHILIQTNSPTGNMIFAASFTYLGS